MPRPHGPRRAAAVPGPALARAGTPSGRRPRDGKEVGTAASRSGPSDVGGEGVGIGQTVLEDGGHGLVSHIPMQVDPSIAEPIRGARAQGPFAAEYGYAVAVRGRGAEAPRRRSGAWQHRPGARTRPRNGPSRCRSLSASRRKTARGVAARAPGACRYRTRFGWPARPPADRSGRLTGILRERGETKPPQGIERRLAVEIAPEQVPLEVDARPWSANGAPRRQRRAASARTGRRSRRKGRSRRAAHPGPGWGMRAPATPAPPRMRSPPRAEGSSATPQARRRPRHAPSYPSFMSCLPSRRSYVVRRMSPSSAHARAISFVADPGRGHHSRPKPGATAPHVPVTGTPRGSPTPHATARDRVHSAAHRWAERGPRRRRAHDGTDPRRVLGAPSGAVIARRRVAPDRRW